MKTWLFKPFIATVMAMSVSLVALAEHLPDEEEEWYEDGPDVPLDLGLTAFLAAGVGYAVKKRKDSKSGRGGEMATEK